MDSSKVFRRRSPPGPSAHEPRPLMSHANKVAGRAACGCWWKSKLWVPVEDRGRVRLGHRRRNSDSEWGGVWQLRGHVSLSSWERLRHLCPRCSRPSLLCSRSSVFWCVCVERSTVIKLSHAGIADAVMRSEAAARRSAVSLSLAAEWIHISFFSKLEETQKLSPRRWRPTGQRKGKSKIIKSPRHRKEVERKRNNQNRHLR